MRLNCQQKTIGRKVYCQGVGVHSGRNVSMCLHPAPANTGIVFRRVDLDHPVELRAHVHAVHKTQLCSVLSDPTGRIEVSTVEHLMAAAAGVGIDNLYVDVDADELAIFDGSALAFIWLFQTAQSVSQAATRRFIRILTPIEVTSGDKWVRLEPFMGYRFDLQIDFSHPVVDASVQSIQYDFFRDSFREQVAYARTFALMRDVQSMYDHGLGLGGGNDNAILVGANPCPGLRTADEFVRHKLLDAIGDLYLAGAVLLGAYSAFKPGHGLHNQLLQALFSDPSAWCYESCSESLLRAVFAAA